MAAVSTAATQPAFSDILARVSRYASEYEQRFSLLVAEERYVQETRLRSISTGGNLSRNNPGGGFSGPRGSEERRVIRSDYLLVRLEGGGGWMPFRDVFEVDGRRTRDREDRLASLFLKPSPSSFDQASRIMQDSTRHNVGSVTRTINIPTLAILFVLPDIRTRFTFAAEGEETIGGRSTVKLAYRETARPTLIRTTPPSRSKLPGAATEDLPLRGALWIDPATGVIVKTTLVAADASVSSEITVVFREEPALDFWVPAQMDEIYRAAGDERDVLGTATYTNYRRFQVSTEEAIKKPPPPAAY